MPSLRVMLDQLLAPVPGGIGRYATEMTRELIAGAPDGWDVVGVVSAVSAADAARVVARLPGLARVARLPVSRRIASLAWSRGFLTGLVDEPLYAPGLFAPVRAARPAGSEGQTSVTVHDTVPWTHPELLTPHGAAWHRAMTTRAWEGADAIFVTTAAIRDALTTILGPREGVYLAPAAPSPALSLGDDADARALALGLPERYLLSVGTLEPRKGLSALVGALALPETQGLPLLVVGPTGWGRLDLARVAADAGLQPGRVRPLGWLDDADLAVVMARATVFVYPSYAEGFGLPILEAFSFGVPVVHSDDPALVEVAGGVGVVVPRLPFPEFCPAIARAVGMTLSKLGEASAASDRRARARAFSWRRSAASIWSVHLALTTQGNPGG